VGDQRNRRDQWMLRQVLGICLCLDTALT
jgi:hypothetical protein